MKLLNEMSHYGTDLDRAIVMINAAVEAHNAKGRFDDIADIDSLVKYLKGRYHDFSSKIEQSVRDIIADELGHEGSFDEDDLALRKDNYNKGLIPDEDVDQRMAALGRYETQAKRDAYQSSDEGDSALRKDNYNKGLIPDEEEEFRGGGKYNRAPQGPEFRGGGKFRSRHRRREPSYFSNKENTRYKDTLTRAAGLNKDEEQENRFSPSRLRARQRAEQEEAKDSDYVDWNKEVRSFRKRRKTYEPEFARQPSRLRSRRKNAASTNPFSVRFESFKQFNEMYRDSQHGLTIDLSGPQGNAFALLGYARSLAKQLGKDWKQIQDDMTYSDYDHLLDVFVREFGSVITLINRPGEDLARIKDREQSDVREPTGSGNIITPPRSD